MKFKKYIALALVTFMLPASSAFAADFTDIKGHWAEEIITDLADKGIVKGYTENKFAPDGTVTRAEFLKMAMEITGIKTVPYRYGECLEAKSSDWFAPYLQSALDKGIIPDNMITAYNVKVVKNNDGTTKAVYSGAFNGNLAITREEMAVIAQYTYQYTRNANTMKDMADSTDLTFTDVNDISGWAYETVKLAAAQGFIGGMDDGTFAPKATATRAQAATIISRMMNK